MMEVGNQIPDFLLLKAPLKCRHCSEAFNNDPVDLLVSGSSAARQCLRPEQSIEFGRLFQEIRRRRFVTGSAMESIQVPATAFVGTA
jgi:hypothetical protein